MTARIIWIGKNNQMVVAPRSALSAGVTAAARPVVLPREGRAAPSLQPRDPSLRGTLVCLSSGQAPLFDATAERWIVPPSTVTVDAGAAADLQHSDETWFPTLPSPAAGPSVAGRFWAEVGEFLTVALGLTVFGVIAGVFLVLA